MTILTKFKPYTPEDPEALKLQQELGITYLVSAEGVDWYESQKLFSPDLLKVVFFWDTGEIVSTGYDVTTLWPNGLCVADVKYEGSLEPEDLTQKVFNVRKSVIEDRVYSEKELAASAKTKISDLQRAAVDLITPLQYAETLEIITEDESAYLKNLQRYVVELNRVTQQEGYPTDIEWPVLPTK